MKTKIVGIHRNRGYELVLENDATDAGRRVLASMTLFEGTGAWMLTDIRLHPHRQPSKYSGSLNASDVTSHYKPESEQAAVIARSLLREFVEDSEGIRWSTYQGLVRGTPRVGSSYLERLNHVGFFSREEGLQHLRELQAWWAEYEGDLADAKVPNPHFQISEMYLFARVDKELNGSN